MKFKVQRNEGVALVIVDDASYFGIYNNETLDGKEYTVIEKTSKVTKFKRRKPKGK